MKKQKTKAMALKLIPSKKFCQVSQVSVGCTSERSLLSQRESWSSQRANLRPAGANAQRYRQKKNPAGYETTKQFETHLLLKLRKISVEYCIYQTFLHTTGVGRDTVSLDFLNSFHLKNLLRKKKKREWERDLALCAVCLGILLFAVVLPKLLDVWEPRQLLGMQRLSVHREEA